MTQLTIQPVVEAGLLATYVAATAAGDKAKNPEGDVVLHVKNGGGAPITVTVTPQKPTTTVAGYGSMTKATVAVAVANATDQFIGPFPALTFNDTNADLIITYSADTSVTVAAIQVPRSQ